VLSPKGDTFVSEPEIERIKTYIATRFTGDQRGQPMALGAPLDVHKLSYNPHEMDLSVVRNAAEERVSAALGIPAAVVGFGTGLEQTKVGAPQPLSARLWTPEGPTTMGAVGQGDRIAVPRGWGRVRQVYPQGEQDIYRVTFQDGSMAESTLDHLWQVHTPNQGWRVVPLSEIASWPAWKLKRATVPLQGVIDFNEQPVLIPPYVLGLLLADGSFRENLFFSNTNVHIVEMIRDQVGLAYAVNQTYPGGYDYRIAYRAAARGRGKGGGTGGYNPFIQELRRIGLWMLTSSEKFVPDVYKYNTVQVRRQLLQGILDGDGYVNLHGQPAIEQTSTRLASDITEIVQSLGGYTLCSLKRADLRTRMIKGHPMASRYDRVHLSIVIDDASSLFSCAEKRDRCRRRTKAASRKMRRIEFVRREQAQCIQVDGSLYLTDNFIVTHNTMGEMRRLAWQNGIIPVQRILAAELSRTLLPQFEANPDRFVVAWDYDEVQALQEDQNDLAKRYQTLVTAGILKVSEAREALGYESDENDEIYLRPISLEPVDPKDQMPEPAPMPAPFGGGAGGNGNGAQNGNGNGNGFVPNGGVGSPGNSRGGRAERRSDSGEGRNNVTEHKQGTLEEWVTEQIGRHAQRLETTPTSLKRVASRIMRQEKRLQPKFRRMILPVLQRHGERAATATREIFPQKARPEDIIRMAIVHERIPLASVAFEMAEVYEQIGSQMVDLLTEAYKSGLGLELTSEARVRALVQHAAAERVRLLDFDGESKEAILRSLDEATQQGLGEEAVVQMIRDRVPAGRWSSSEMRAQIIARSESRYLANVATARYAEESGAGRVLILDALLGPTDETCEVRNGWVVTPSEARVLAGTEHPHGTMVQLPLTAAQVRQ
jgi:hypothetical protein